MLLGLGTVRRKAHVVVEKMGGHTQDRLNIDGWVAGLVTLSPAFIGCARRSFFDDTKRDRRRNKVGTKYLKLIEIV